MKELVVNVYRVLYIQNVIINVVEIYLVVMYVNKDVQLNVFVIRIVQIFVLMVIVQKNVVKFVSIVPKNAVLNVNILPVQNYVENYVIENHVMKDAIKK